MADLAGIVRYLDTELRTREIPDYDGALNGLQLANSGRVTKVATAVDFSALTVQGALGSGATLLIVHHGMFWRGAERLVDVAYTRLRAAITCDLAVYASHLPLDLHPTLGNNARLATELALSADGTFGRFRDIDVGLTGVENIETRAIVERVRAFAMKSSGHVVHTPIDENRRTRRWAIVTGSGASSASLVEAADRGVDTLIVGEGPHHTAVDAMERGIVVIYAGHYATETLGVRALGEAVSKVLGVPSAFIDVPTGL